MIDSAIGFCVDYVLKPTLVLGILAMPVLFAALVYVNYFQEHKLIQLRADEWVCSKTEEYTYSTYILVGKVPVPQVHSGTTCTEYKKS